MTFTDPEPSFQGHGIYEVEYLKKGEFYGHSNHTILTGIHTKHMEWYQVW